MTQTDAPDTAAVQGTADYFNRKANPDDPECICRGIPDGQHIKPCPKNMTPDACCCENCGNRQAFSDNICEVCGYQKES